MRRWSVRDALIVATAAIVAAIATTACGILGEIPPKPVSNWTVADARVFDEFALYWLGESYQGLPLVSVSHSTDGDGVHHASFSYGELSYFGDAASGSWLSPLEIDIQPYCGYSPEEHLSYDRYGDPEVDSIEIRGVNGYVERYDFDWHYLFLWSGTSAIHIGTYKTAFDIEQAAWDLIPIAEGTGATLKPLTPPITTEC